ncbi:GTPase-activating protein [Puccinia graminis f. sp. tritici]|uniref:GTPase-activating protein n=1 Tax=Puccinia graminis f. sp. tritici TaxID=56615 RepID=A0A5B0Q805_PUCGR|nr:GTPase-activating protein [Puccinia graminis f. sp. tritici]
MITTSPPGSSSRSTTHNSKKKNQLEEKQRERELIEDTDQAWDDHSDQEESKTTTTQPIIRTRKLSLENNPSHQAHQSTPPPPPPPPLPLPTIQSNPLDHSDPIGSPSASTSSTHSTFSKDIFSLIKDPAYILSRLKTEYEQQEQSSPLDTPSRRGRGSLPWEAVIPAELMTKKVTGSRSPSPTPPTGSGPGPYTLLPETPNQPGPSSEALKREQKFVDCLESPTVDVGGLRKLAWAGIPPRLRALVWMILLGYLPAPQSRRLEVLARKRREYLDALRLAFASGTQKLDQTIWHQIQIDVARTNPGVPLWQFHATQRSLERILYVWAIRHPASGYVQGINDLVTPFFQVFLTAYIDGEEAESFDVGRLPAEALEAIEADSFWSLSKLLEGIQDNYIFAQPGIQRQVARMKELCERVDARLHRHLEDEKVEFIQFAFRWINCLLMRELSTKKIIRMWDTYLLSTIPSFQGPGDRRAGGASRSEPLLLRRGVDKRTPPPSPHAHAHAPRNPVFEGKQDSEGRADEPALPDAIIGR